MLAVLVAIVLGLMLLGAAALKLAGGGRARTALATYGLRGRGAAAAWAALIAIEAGLGVAVAAGVDGTAYAAAGLMAVFALAQAVLIAGGRAGAPCACLGARGRVGRGSLARASALAVALAALPLLERREPSGEEWLAIGRGCELAGIVVLAVAVLALAREIGMLRLAVGPRGALEIPHEGPEIGGRTALAGAFGRDLARGRLGLAVFTSEGCAMCHALAPAVAAFARDPHVAVREFDEVRDAPAWAAADVPGSPFAVALDEAGTVLAKGTFNSGAQLESVLAAAERRRGALHAAR